MNKEIISIGILLEEEVDENAITTIISNLIIQEVYTRIVDNERNYIELYTNVENCIQREEIESLLKSIIKIDENKVIEINIKS